MSGKRVMLFLATTVFCAQTVFPMINELERNPQIIQAKRRLNQALELMMQHVEQNQNNPLYKKYAAINTCSLIKESQKNHAKQKLLLKALLQASISSLNGITTTSLEVLRERSVEEFSQSPTAKSINTLWQKFKKLTQKKMRAVTENYANPSIPLLQQEYDDIFACVDAIEQLATMLISLAGHIKIGDFVSSKQFNENYLGMCAAAAVSVQFLRTLETCIDDGIFDTNQEEIREQLARFDTLVATNAPLAELNRQATLLLLVSLRPLTLVIERISQQIPIEQAHTLSQKISVTFENLVQLLSTDEWTNQLPKEVTENLKAFQNMLIQKFGRAMLETKQVT